MESEFHLRDVQKLIQITHATAILIFRLYVLTFYHCQFLKKEFPPCRYPQVYGNYFHQLEIHAPLLYRVFNLHELASEREESTWRFEKLKLAALCCPIEVVMVILKIQSNFHEVQDCKSTKTMLQKKSYNYTPLVLPEWITTCRDFKFFLHSIQDYLYDKLGCKK